MRVLILDGAERTSLAIARSLGKKGIEVHCGESYRYSTTSFSKYCTKNLVYPDPQIDCQGFINGLKNILKTGNYDVLYSSREVTTIPISYYKSDLEQYTKIPFPDYHKILLTHDKLQTVKLAIQEGLAVPKTYFIENIEQLEDISSQMAFPLVVKSRFKTIWKKGKPVMLKVTEKNYVYNFEDLKKISSLIFHQTGKPPLIQEYIQGDAYGVEVLCDHGEPKALFMHKRIHEYPIRGGASTLRESVFNPQLKDAALKILKKLEWHGVAMVEFKLDKTDNKPKLIEINGRFWGSLALSVAAGIDFPYLLHQMVMGKSFDSSFNYENGIECRWLLPGEFLWLFASLKNDNNKLSNLWNFVSDVTSYDDILSLDDVMPSIGAMRVMFHQIGSVVKGRRNIDGELV